MRPSVSDVRPPYIQWGLAAFLIVWWLAGGAPLAAQPARAREAPPAGYPIRDFLAATHVAEVALSPDGQDVAFITSRDRLAEDESEIAVWRLRLGSAGARPTLLERGRARTRALRWSPDGRWISYLRAPDDSAPGSLVLVSSAGTTHHAIESPAPDTRGVVWYDWARDEGALYVVARGAAAPRRPTETVATGAPATRVVPAQVLFRIAGADVRSGRATRLASLPADIAAAEQLAISPAGDAIAAPRAAAPTSRTPAKGPTGACRLRSRRRGAWRPVLRWTHAGIVFGAYGERADSAWRLTQSRLYRISRDAVRGAGHDDAPIAERLGSGFGGEAGWKAGSQDVLIGDARTGDVFAIGFAGTQSVLLHLPAGSTEFREAARLPGEVTALSAAPDGRTLAIGLSRRDRFPEVYVARVGSGPSGARVSEFRPVTDLNATLNALPAPTVETIRWPNGEGDLVNGVLYWPPGRQGARGLPLVVVAHGGPFSLVLERLTNPTAWAYYPALLASRGYLVLYPNYRGSTGQGDEFVRKLIGYGCSRPVADVVSGVDHLVAQGWADSARVGIAGASAGGTVVNCAIGRSGRFRAAASAEGFWNNFSAYATSRSASPTTLVDGGLRRGEPWGAFDRDRWWQESALASAASIRTPTIVVHGARDVNVDAGQSREMAFALRRLGVPHRLMLFEDEAHHFTRPSNKLTKVAAEIDWLDRYLLRDGQP